MTFCPCDTLAVRLTEESGSSIESSIGDIGEVFTQRYMIVQTSLLMDSRCLAFPFTEHELSPGFCAVTELITSRHLLC